jgi:hypothetical protein
MFESNKIYVSKGEYALILKDQSVYIINKDEKIMADKLQPTSNNILLIESGALEEKEVENKDEEIIKSKKSK